MIRNLKIMFFVVLCLSLGSCKKIIKSSDNFIEHKVLSKGGKEISKEAAERSAKEFGNSYVGKSAGRQLVRNAVRKKVEKEMEEEGAKSFFQFGSKKASKALAHISVPSANKSFSKAHDLSYNNYLKEIKDGKHRTISATYSGKRAKNMVFSKTDHINIISKYASSLGLDEKQQEKLLNEMIDDIGLAELIHSHPQFNIKRWVIARKSVDKTKLAKVNGRTVVNGNQYAGKSFFFNPHLNRDIKSKLDAGKLYNNSTYEQLIALDKKYPNGIPFTEKGFPDFIKADACYKMNGKVLKVTLPNFTGDRAKDNILANKFLLSKGINIKTEGYTWHHMEGIPPTMVLVDSDVHSVVKHSGGHSMTK